MKLEIVIPKQVTTSEGIEIDDEIIIIGEVTGFWTYAQESTRYCWGINPNGLSFSSYPGCFINLELAKFLDNGEFRLSGEYRYVDPDDKEVSVEDVVFKVTLVREVQDFPPITTN